MSVPQRLRAVREGAVIAVTAGRVELALRRRRPLPQIAASLGITLGVALPGETVDSAGTAAEQATHERAALPDWARWRHRVVRRAMKAWPFGDTCLRVALVLGFRLRTLGPVLRIGIGGSADDVLAHAWIEVGGHVLDPLAADYRPLRSMTPDDDA